MTIQSKITLLLSLIFFTFVVWLFYVFDNQSYSFEVLLEDTKGQQVALFDQLMEVKGENAEILVRDYSFWDEMVDFIKGDNPSFAEESVDTGVETYAVSVAQIYDIKRDLVYEAGAPALSIPEEVFTKLYQDRFIHFFAETEGGVIEVRGATVHPSNDNERKTDPQGYFFVGEEIDQEYIGVLEDITRSTVAVLPRGTNISVLDKNIPQEGYISFVRTLKDWNNRVVGYVHVEKLFVGISDFYNAFSRQFIFFCIFLAVLAVIIYEFLSQLVGRPLRTLSRSIRDRDLKPVEKMQNERSEFGDLAGLVLKFSEHERLVKEKAYDDAVLSAVGSGLVAVDEKGIITLFNVAGERLLGIGAGMALGKRIGEVFQVRTEKGETFGSGKDPFSSAFSLQKTTFLKLQIYRMNEGFFPALGVIAPVIINGKNVGAVMDFTDMTEEHRIDKAKTEFVSLISHQLRTPLTIIGWYVDRLRRIFSKEVKDPKFHEYIEAIIEANERMVKLVNATVEVSRIELSRLNPTSAAIDLVRITDEVINELTPLIDKKGIIIKRHYDEYLPKPLLDERLVFMIAQNLISNAVKYTKDGGVISVSITKDGGGERIAVSDTGIGIADTDKERIFDKLFRAEEAQKIDPEGSGLGLYIAKAMTEVLGGTIGFSSLEGKGTTFFVRLPFSVPVSIKK